MEMGLRVHISYQLLLLLIVTKCIHRTPDLSRQKVQRVAQRYLNSVSGHDARNLQVALQVWIKPGAAVTSLRTESDALITEDDGLGNPSATGPPLGLPPNYGICQT